MPKSTAVFVCQVCGARARQFFGRCPECGSWNSLVEQSQPANDGRRRRSALDPEQAAAPRRSTAMAALEDQPLQRLATGTTAWMGAWVLFLRSGAMQMRNMIWPWRRKSRRRMARIVVDGPITGATRKRVLKALREVKQREFPALLLRIDSPGGTVGDSQEIHAALLRLREQGCRVVASFGNISASGGVYIGVAAEKIVANPGTITGSIGVILRGNDLSRVFEKIGIRFDTVKSGPFKDILSPDRPLSDAERALLQELIDSSYGQFVGVVAQGRNLELETVKRFADGRVFSGEQAQVLGLVDELGDEDHARRLAAQLADLDADNIRPVTLGKQSRKLSGLLPGSQLLLQLQERVSIELMGSGQVLWLYRP